MCGFWRHWELFIELRAVLGYTRVKLGVLNCALDGVLYFYRRSITLLWRLRETREDSGAPINEFRENMEFHKGHDKDQ
jgi:hypothetical protein